MSVNRRRFIAGVSSLGATAFAGRLSASDGRRISFRHIHTRETLDVLVTSPGLHDAQALGKINRLMRDFRTREEHPIDEGLLAMLADLQGQFDRPGVYEIISAYRSPKTNRMLRNTTTGVAKKSYHMTGRAIDVRLTGVATSRLRQAAVDLARGGVGYYPTSDFLHLDMGPVRSWGG